MDIFFVVFAAFLILIIAILLVRLLKIEDAPPFEPVTQRDYEAQYQALMERIQTLEERVRHGAATRKMKVELENLGHQAENLLTLLTPSLITDIPQHDQLDYNSESPFTLALSTVDRRNPQICSRCGSQVLVNDKFCANCGSQLQKRVQS